MSVLQITKSMIVLILSFEVGPQVGRRSGERATLALLAQSTHVTMSNQCRHLGVKQTLR